MTVNVKPAMVIPAGSSGMPTGMTLMEHPKNTLAVPPLVDEGVLMQFCQAVQSYADGAGMHSEAAEKLRNLQATLANLRNLASLCRFAILDHPFSFARVIDEMHCISVDFPSDPLEQQDDGVGEFQEDEPDNRVQLAAAVDLFAGAAFVSKDNPYQRDRFIVGIVRAIEDAIAFPVTFAAEAASYLGQGTTQFSSDYASIVIGNATQRLIESDKKCAPRMPAKIRMRLERLACQWMRANPVTEFFKVLSGPKVWRIVHWEDPSRDQPDDALIGDPVTLLFRLYSEDGAEPRDDIHVGLLRDLGVMFCPHQPAEVVRVVKDGLQVRVPEQAVTGPVAVVQKAPNFEKVWKLLWEYAQLYPVEVSSSIFGWVRMDVWAYPRAFGGPILEIAQVPTGATADAFTSAGPLTNGQSVAVGDTVAIHYRVNPPGSAAGVPMSVHAPGGIVTGNGKPGVLLYRPSSPGDIPVKLTWGNLKVTIPISVKPTADPRKGMPS